MIMTCTYFKLYVTYIGMGITIGDITAAYTLCALLVDMATIVLSM